MTTPPPNPHRRRWYTPEALAYAKQRYEGSDEPMEAIAADLGICRKSLGAVARREGWALRLKARPPIARARGFTPAAAAHARRRYEDTDESIDKIAADLGVSRFTLDKLAKTEGWQLRKDRPPRDLPLHLQIEQAAVAMLATARAAEAAPAQAEPGGSDPAVPTPADPSGEAPRLSLALRLEAAVAQELRKVENLRDDAVLSGSRPAEAERIARTLAALTQTLFKVRQLREPGDAIDEHDDLPVDADDFRRELARRIEAFVASRADGGLGEGDAAAGAGAAGA